MKKFMASIFLIAIIGLSSKPSEAATRQDLQAEVNALVVRISSNSAQSIAIINALTVALAPPQSLTVGTVAGRTSVDLPVYFKSSTSPVSSLQFDVVLSSGLSVSNVTPGIAAQAAGKGTQGNPVTGGFRVLVFGVNQTAIPSGPVAILRLSVGSNVGKRPIPLTNLSASSPAGSNVPLTSKQGTVAIQ